MKQQQDAHRYRQWEKSRRDRFNLLLLGLAKTLPNYREENSEPQGENDKGHKWSKAEIVERATAHIKALEAAKMTPDIMKAVRRVKIQNRKLRELIRRELKLTLDEAEFRSLTLEEIREVLKKQKEAAGALNEVTPDSATDPSGESSVAPEVFVAELASTDDHSYSLKVQTHAEIEIQGEEPQEEEPSLQQPEQRSPTPPAAPLASTAPTSTNTQPIIIPVIQPQQPLGQPQLAAATLAAPFMLPSQTVFLRALHPADKLPLPRLRPVVSATNGPPGKQKVTTGSSQKVRKRKKKKSEKAAENKEGRSFSLSDVTRVDSALPETILASEEALDEDEDEVETIDLTEESGQTVKNKAVEDSGGKPSTPTQPLTMEGKTSSVMQRVIASNSSSPTRTGKRSSSSNTGSSTNKSSYSIAALCQISVNIDSASVGSPGVISLASEAASPTGTPASNTPTPPMSSKSDPATTAPAVATALPVAPAPAASTTPAVAPAPAPAAAPAAAIAPAAATAPATVMAPAMAPVTAPTTASTTVSAAVPATAAPGQKEPSTATTPIVKTPALPNPQAAKDRQQQLGEALMAKTSRSQSPERTKVIQDLSPSKSSRTEEEKAPVSKFGDLSNTNGNKSAVEKDQSPSKSFLTNFPVVPTQSETCRANASKRVTVATAPSDSSVTISSSTVGAITIDNTSSKRVPLSTSNKQSSEKASASSISAKKVSDLSVYDFKEDHQAVISGRLFPKSPTKQQPQESKTCAAATIATSVIDPQLQQQASPILPRKAVSTTSSAHSTRISTSSSSTSSKGPKTSSTHFYDSTTQLHPPPPPISSQFHHHFSSHYPALSTSTTAAAAAAAAAAGGGGGQLYPHHHQHQGLSAAAFPPAAVAATTESPNFQANYAANQHYHHHHSSHHHSTRYYDYQQQPQQNVFRQQQAAAGGGYYPGAAAAAVVPMRHHYPHPAAAAAAAAAAQYRGPPAGAATYAGQENNSKSSDRKVSRSHQQTPYDSSNRSKSGSMTTTALGSGDVNQMQCHLVQNEQGKVFSVTHLVSTKHQQLQQQQQQISGGSGRKTSKRSAPTSSAVGAASNKNSVKQPRVENSGQKESKDEGIKRQPSKAQRNSSRSKVKAPYSAESLLSAAAFTMEPPSSTYTEHALETTTAAVGSSSQSKGSWGSEGLPFTSSSSTSPASAAAAAGGGSIFGSDLATLDFSAALFGHDAPSMSMAANPGAARGYTSQQQHLPNQHQNMGTNKRPPSLENCQVQQQLSRGHHQHHHPQPSITPHQQDYLGGSGIFDNNFFPLPTITPPNVDDPYGGFNNVYPPPPLPPPPRQSYAKHPHQQQQHVQQQQQMVVTSSVTNFNLSTIFPEMTTGGGGGGGEKAPNLKQLVPNNSGSSNNEATTTSTQAGGSSAAATSATAAAASHGLPILGSGNHAAPSTGPAPVTTVAHQMGLGSVPPPFPPTAGFGPGLNFQLPEQQ